MEERIVKKLMTSVKCSTCGQTYAVRNITILGRYQHLWFISGFCPACRTYCLLVATVSRDKVQIATDLTGEEMARFKHLPRLTANDVLDMHNFLKKFNGDFSRLFGRERV